MPTLAPQRPHPGGYYQLVTMEDGLFFSYLLSRPSFDGRREREGLRALD